MNGKEGFSIITDSFLGKRLEKSKNQEKFINQMKLLSFQF